MAAAPYYDRVLETTTTTGTGTLNLAGAVTGHQGFVAAVGTGNTTPMCVWDVDANGVPSGDWEVRIGCTVTDASPDTITRGTLLASSTGSAVSFGAGTKRVAQMLPAAIINGLVAASEGHIRGLIIDDATNTTISCSAGSAFIEGLGMNIKAAPATITPTMIGSAGIHYVYLYVATPGATPVIVDSSSVAPASTPFAGNARSASGTIGGNAANLHRFLGWWFEDASSHIRPFTIHELGVGSIDYQYDTATSVAPFRVLDSGAQGNTFSSAISMAGILPPNVCVTAVAQYMSISATNEAGDLQLSTDGVSSNSARAYATANPSFPVIGLGSGAFQIKRSTPAIYYKQTSSSSAAIIDVRGAIAVR